VDFPSVIFWAWERPENLKFIDPKKIGVAFLAQTLILKNDEVIFQPRRQPLEIPPETFLIAVTRIETNRVSKTAPSLSDSQKQQILILINQTLNLPNVKAVQIDFDARVSERNFYQNMLTDLRSQMPANVPLTITGLASWCAFDKWVGDLPVDEVVPMTFRMGADDKPIRDFLARDNDWHEPLCRASYGLALDEPFPANFKLDRRFYIFNNRSWKFEDLKRLPEGVLP
jgi:hypothetical protein